jgi:hypothetical protein
MTIIVAQVCRCAEACESVGIMAQAKARMLRGVRVESEAFGCPHYHHPQPPVTKHAEWDACHYSHNYATHVKSESIMECFRPDKDSTIII